MEDLAREHVHGSTRLRCREWPAVGVHHLLRELSTLDAAGQDLLDEEVALQDQIAAQRTAEQARRHPRDRVGLGPRPRVPDHERRESLGVSGRRGESDRAAPVVHHQRDVAQVERFDEPLDHL